MLCKAPPDYRWENVDVRAYKEEASAPDLSGELRYFEVAPGGWTTLERHSHVNAVTILRGSGRVLVGHKGWRSGRWTS